ncbi:unnamed protein product [Schistosoma curassoni]|uniref:Serine/threonine-protein kinase n=1 Tax=Schistosoma curassoni TaxID=6186 RepID=A0A183KJA9_9TREM|nr:unnamed protein product [Schistosoma curassoni]
MDLSCSQSSLHDNECGTIALRPKKGRTRLLCASKIITDSSLLSLCSFSNLTGYSNSGSKESVSNITNNSNNNTDRDRTLKYPNRGSFLENISKPKEWKSVPQSESLIRTSRQSYYTELNAENYRNHHQKCTSIYKQLTTQDTQHPLAGYHQQQRSVRKDVRSGYDIHCKNHQAATRGKF